MKRGQQLLSVFLVLCVALAGAVGISPTLHVWVEHGGHGHAHSHAGFPKCFAPSTEHAHPHPHPGAVPRASEENDELERLLAEKYPQPKLFGLEVKDVYRAIGSLLARVLEHLPEAPVDDNGDGEGHTHYSLAQMLLSGAVEGISDFPPLVYAPVVLTFSIRLSSTFVVACDFDPQTASRAPPVRS